MKKIKYIFAFIFMALSLIAFLVFYSLLCLHMKLGENNAVYIGKQQGNFYYETLTIQTDKKLVPKGKITNPNEVDKIDLSYNVYLPDSNEYRLDVDVVVIAEDDIEVTNFIKISQVLNGREIGLVNSFTKDMKQFYKNDKFNLTYRVVIDEPKELVTSKRVTNKKIKIGLSFKAIAIKGGN